MVGLFLLLERIVSLLVEQRLELIGVLDSQLEHPSSNRGALVDECGVVLQLLICFQHRARDGRVDFRCRLDTLDRSHGVSLGDSSVDCRALHEDDVAQLLGSKVGDADGADVSRDRHPLVLLRVVTTSGKAAAHLDASAGGEYAEGEHG
ncbi:hypothetical protein PFISCL1PPCAC_21673, partial [Pristionchus fissidentatus]